ncbi:SIS domain-containing protein [Peptoanaerobacter stomatis]|uniref:SIS domain-containing protein n=1 Tax=Peptoanaerobacter stomatis TaxID=796937 RepID=UPI003F9EDCA4
MDIKLIAFDIDGVITNGKVTVDENGKESKSIDFRDIDSMFELKRQGYKTAFITGEDSVISKYFNDRFQPDYFYNAVKNKEEILKEISMLSGIQLKNICYIGDGKYDINAMKIAGYSICPQNSIKEIKEVSKITLSSNGGDGFIYDVKNLLLNKINNNKENFIEKENKNFSNIENLLKRHEDVFIEVSNSYEIKTQIETIVEIIIGALNNKNTIYTFGNGGSAADAQHIAGEFVGRFFKERKALPCEALTANNSIITALGNDYTYDIVFSRQVEAKCKKGDVLIGLSTSGKSKNVLKAFEEGKKIGTVNIALIGSKTNNVLDEFADIIVKIPSDITPAIQEMHMMLNHIICQIVEEKMFDKIVNN